VFGVTSNIDFIIQKIRDYQRYVILNRQFIRELEQEGGETSELLKEVASLEAKILELQMKCRRYL